MATTPPTESMLAANVTAARTEADRSVSWLAKRTGIKRSTLAYQIRNGRFPVANLLLIASALDRDIVDLITVQDEAA